MLTFKVLAALLDYPNAETVAAIPEMRTILKADGIDAPALLLARLESADLLDCQADWVDLFDRTRAGSLHLFEHVHGDSRDRGQAMVDLAGLYGRHGLSLQASELPDYLPAFLEFLSLLPEAEARTLLGEAAHVVEALADRVGRRNAEYGMLLATVAGLAEGPAKAVHLATGDVDEDIDAAWAEAEVRFGAGAALGGC